MSQQTESVLNNVLIDMARSFLQYIAECWPWVDEQAQSIGEQVAVIAERQRQDVGEIVGLLTARECFVDFGTFPTEYTDQQFLALEAVFDSLRSSQELVCSSIATGLTAVKSANDDEAAQLLQAIEVRQKEAAHALKELQRELAEFSASA